jgi:hypothetical protein
MTTEQKYIWLAILALGLGLWLCRDQLVPKKPAQVLRSPKDAPVPKKPTEVLRSPKATPERALALPVAHVNRFYLAWDNSNTVPVGFVVEYKTDLLMPWFPLGMVTNATRWPLNSFRESTNRTEYFRVGAFLP